MTSKELVDLQSEFINTVHLSIHENGNEKAIDYETIGKETVKALLHFRLFEGCRQWNKVNLNNNRSKK